jgi:hypothetical protein
MERINKHMKYKYYTHANKPESTSHLGRPVDPTTWKSGPDPFKREKYYAWLKHRAQAQYRNEPYQLTWEDWDSVWTDDDFRKRGRKNTDYCIARIDPDDAWCIHNCHVVTRRQHLQRNREFRKDQNGG